MDATEARIYLAVIITGIVLGTILLYFTISIIRQQRRNLELQKANALAEISAMEKERGRIAADLHDELGPVLSVIKFQVDNVEQVDAEEKLQLQKASQSLDELIEKMREVANNLMPSALQRKGLIAAIHEFTQHAANQQGAEIYFSADPIPAIPEEKGINIYRVVQESIHNSLKHSRASKIDIGISEKGGVLRIVCRDNGQGFNYEKAIKESAGIGLRSLKNRTDIMGGTMTVESKINSGTAFLFEIPLK